MPSPSATGSVGPLPPTAVRNLVVPPPCAVPSGCVSGIRADDVDGKAPAVVVSGRAIGRGMTRPSPGSTSNVRPAESSSISFKPV